jgi:hypothetical protein
MRQTSKKNTWCRVASDKLTVPKLIRYYSTVRHDRLLPEPTAVSESYKIRGSHSGVADNSKFVTCDTVFLGEWFKMFRRMILSHLQDPTTRT